MKLLLYILTLGIASLCHNSLAEMRTWNSSDGRSMEAEYRSSDEESVTIDRKGKEFTLQLDQLSEEDQNWVKEKTASTAKEETEKANKENSYFDSIDGTFFRHKKNGQEYRLFGKKELLESGEKYPLVVYLHGHNRVLMEENPPWEGSFFTTEKNFSERPCFIYLPQCPKPQSWMKNENLESALKNMDDIIEHLPIDTNRIYLIGFSMGSHATFETLEKHSDTFAAAVPFGGWGDTGKIRKYKHVPVWLFHGEQDKAISHVKSQEMYEAMQKADFEVKYTKFPEKPHVIIKEVFTKPSLHSWLFSHSKQNKKKDE